MWIGDGIASARALDGQGRAVSVVRKRLDTGYLALIAVSPAAVCVVVDTSVPAAEVAAVSRHMIEYADRDGGMLSICQIAHCAIAATWVAAWPHIAEGLHAAGL